MRQLPIGFAQKLESSVTTLCLAWAFMRSDGLEIRVTNHDCDLIIDSKVYKSTPSLSAGTIETDASFAPDSFNAIGGYEIDGIEKNDILLGRWDRAKVKLFVADWTQTEYYIEIWGGFINGFRQSKFGFEMELVGPEQQLSNIIGRKYTRQCCAQLGDNFCKINLAQPSHQKSAQISALKADRIIEIINIGGETSDFEFGHLGFNSGELIGIKISIKTIIARQNIWEIHLSRPLAIMPKLGDEITLFVGCDKSFDICKTRFANQANFRGFPHMPGEDFAFSAAK